MTARLDLEGTMMVDMEMEVVAVGAGVEEDTVGEAAIGVVGVTVEEAEGDGDMGPSIEKVNDTLHSEGVWEGMKQCCILFRVLTSFESLVLAMYAWLVDVQQHASMLIMLNIQTFYPADAHNGPIVLHPAVQGTNPYVQSRSSS